MSLLTIYAIAESPVGDAARGYPEALARLTSEREIAARLAPHGVRFRRWTPGAAFPTGGSNEQLLAAYAEPIAQLSREGDYRSADVVQLKRDPADPDWQHKASAARQKFLAEHRHAEDEVRFFVAGSGLFSLRLGDEVYQIMCEAGDLLSVPAGTRHWFDMGSAPHFVAIRLFGSPDGWAAQFTGDDVATRFPSFDQVKAGL